MYKPRPNLLACSCPPPLSVFLFGVVGLLALLPGASEVYSQVFPNDFVVLDARLESSPNQPLDTLLRNDSVNLVVQAQYRGQPGQPTTIFPQDSISFTYYVRNLNAPNPQPSLVQLPPLDSVVVGNGDTFITSYSQAVSAQVYPSGENVIVIWPSGASIAPTDTTESDTFTVLDSLPNSRPQLGRNDWLKWEINSLGNLSLESRYLLERVRIWSPLGQLLANRPVGSLELQNLALPAGMVLVEVVCQNRSRAVLRLLRSGQ